MLVIYYDRVSTLLPLHHKTDTQGALGESFIPVQRFSSPGCHLDNREDTFLP